MARSLFSSLEPLESRIAPASIAVIHPLTDIVAGIGKTGATVDLGNMFSNQPNAGYDTFVDITTNYDTDPNTPGIQAGHIIIELYNSVAPLSVQNFLSYVTSNSYVGTIIHRTADFYGSSTASIIQGGGYSASNLGQHIATGPTLHNEYSDTLPNSIGTIAVAKTGIGPNTGTSEWFINTADNSSTLGGSNDGGYTVFGKIVSGLDVATAIASLPTASMTSVNSALGSVPYQGTLASGKLPTGNQLIKITGVSVTDPQSATSPGYTFKVTSDDNPGLVTTSVHGQSLKLNYKAGATGTADITVGVYDTKGNAILDSANNPITETFKVTVEPNLIANITADSFGQSISNGSTGTISTKITNSQAGVAKGLVDINYYLAPIPSNGQVVLDSSAVLIATKTGVPINIASGKSAVLTEKLTASGLDTLTNGTNYQIIAEVVPEAGTAKHPAIQEYYSDDNFSQNGSYHTYDATGGPKIVATSKSDTLQQVIVPGDSGKTTIQLTDTTSFNFTGTVHVDYYLVHVADPSNPGATTIDTTDTTNDIKIGSLDLGSKPITLTAGKALTLTGAISLGNTLLPYDTADYVVLADVTLTDSNNKVTHVDTTISSTSREHLGANGFGTIANDSGTSVRKNIALTYEDTTNHNLVTLKLTGSEFGIVSQNSSGGYDLAISSIYDPSAAFGSAALTASVKTESASLTSHAKFDNLTAYQFVGNISLGNADFSGDINLPEGVKSLTLGNLNAPIGTTGNINIGTSALSAGISPALKFGGVTDYNLTSTGNVGSIAATTWNSSLVPVPNPSAPSTTPSPLNLSMPGLSTLSIPGYLEANVTVSSPLVASTPVVKSFSVGLALSSSTVNIAGGVTSMSFGHMESSTVNLTSSSVPLKTFTVAQNMTTSTVQVAGDVGAVSIGGMTSSNFLVGVNQSNGAPVIPTQRSDFSSIHTIASFTFTGVTSGQVMSASNVAAANFGLIQMSTPDASAQSNYGFIAETIAKYQSGTATLTDPGPNQYDTNGNYAVTVLPA